MRLRTAASSPGRPKPESSARRILDASDEDVSGFLLAPLLDHENAVVEVDAVDGTMDVGDQSVPIGTFGDLKRMAVPSVKSIAQSIFSRTDTEVPSAV
jgi:hypothetical protein